MLYLEDFLELLEPFPSEIKEKLEKIRSIDLIIQNEGNKLDTKVETFFHQCNKKQKSNEWQEENYNELRKEYLKLVDNADDKIQTTNQLYDLCEKYIKKLEQEIHKFKLELEADNAGITARLERAVAANEYETNVNDDFHTIFDDQKTANLIPVYTDFHNQLESLNSLNSPLNFNDTFSGVNYSQQNLSPTNSVSSNLIPTNVRKITQKRSHVANNSITAIRTNSSNSSLIDMFQSNFTRRNKRLKIEDYDDLSNQTLTDTNDDETELQAQLDEDYNDEDNESSSTTLNNDNNNRHFKREELNQNEDATQEEQKYCLCKDVSYGDMICCDNRNCKTQWFHFTCVGLSQAPKGKWFCPICANQQKRRQRRHQLNDNNQTSHQSIYAQLLNQEANEQVSTSSSSTTSSNLLQHQRSLKQSNKNDDFDMEFY